MNLKEIKEMINLMNENNLAELEMEKEGLKIRLKKAGAAVEAYQVQPSAGPTAASLKESDSSHAAAKAAETTAFIYINSPMVGTFYRAPTPDAEFYVKAGQEVDENQVVCIVEAMKLMNEIKADVRGRIKEILVENGEPVEFGQPLFAVEPL